MPKFSIERVPDLSREELVALVLQLAERIQQLEEEVERLKKPPATSSNSSLPSSREPKSNLPSPSQPRRRGAKPGHAKMERPLSETPDQVIVATLERCVQCGLDLGQVSPTQMIRRQVTELPVMKPIIVEMQQPVVICPRCQHEQRGRWPAEFAAGGSFGARLEATVTY
ncbi:MAG TPA: DUF6444 domain-containing protein, partial [Anaerolineales bacterium]|nr:DUF6444 domain-containing protein [Anaerolineales bacterium]